MELDSLASTGVDLVENVDIDSHLTVMLPDSKELPDGLLSDYGGLYCILRTDTWEVFSGRKRKTHESVFTAISSNDGKLFETEVGAVNAAKRILEQEKGLSLVVTYYGIALSTYYKSCFCAAQGVL